MGKGLRTIDQATDTVESRLRRPPQVALGLDSEAQVLFINKDLAGTVFAALREEAGVALHTLVHPDCDGDCRFNALFRKAWSSLKAKRASVEWELVDPVRDSSLRLNLSRQPASKEVAVDRRQLLALLTITDITETRREYESVISSNEELQRRIAELEDQHAANEPSAKNGGAETPAELGTRIIEAREYERRRIAADLHDGVAQTLSVVKFGVESRIADLSRKVPDLDLAEFEQILDRIREALDDLRRVSRNLSPAPLADFGLCTGIKLLCDEFSSDMPDIEAVCETCIDEGRLPEVIQISIYRVVQEALNYIGKHALASRVTVSLTVADDGVTLTIADDGAGFDAGEIQRGMGLASMRERVEVSGGTFELHSIPQQGTEISASWSDETLRLL